MKLYSNCSNAGELSIDLPNLLCSKLCLFPAMVTNTISKIMQTLQKRANSMTVVIEVIVNMITLSLIMLQVGVNSKKEDSSFHQADLTQIQVINKNIKGLNRRSIYRTFSNK